MVILGLGSNIHDRLAYLRAAYLLIKKIPHVTVKQVSRIYESPALLPKNAPSSWNAPYFNLCMRIETTLTPHELLFHTKQIEKCVGRTPSLEWGPRIIDIDILAWDNEIFNDEKLHIPHEHLHERAFALYPFVDVAPFWIYPLKGSCQGKTAIEMAALCSDQKARPIPHRIDIPELVGIVNITPDSFSDGGTFSSTLPSDLVGQGARVIDFGAEATGPKATPLSPDTEWNRLASVLKKFMAERSEFLTSPKISVDTYHFSVAKKALNLKVDWINDITGLDDPKMQEVIAASPCDVVFMHHLGVPVSHSALIPLAEDPITHVYEWAEKRIAYLTSQGINASRLIFDVGIGYGKTAEQSLALLREIAIFKKLGVRLLVGHSRKSFIEAIYQSKPIMRDLETSIISLHLAKEGVDYLRVHNIFEHLRVFNVSTAFAAL